MKSTTNIDTTSVMLSLVQILRIKCSTSHTHKLFPKNQLGLNMQGDAIKVKHVLQEEEMTSTSHILGALPQFLIDISGAMDEL